MLTFKKSGYTNDDLIVLREALAQARFAFTCNSNGCDECTNRKPCADITRCREHVRSVLNDTQNQSY